MVVIKIMAYCISNKSIGLFVCVIENVRELDHNIFMIHMIRCSDNEMTKQNKLAKKVLAAVVCSSAVIIITWCIFKLKNKQKSSVMYSTIEEKDSLSEKGNLSEKNTVSSDEDITNNFVTSKNQEEEINSQSVENKDFETTSQTHIHASLVVNQAEIKKINMLKEKSDENRTFFAKQEEIYEPIASEKEDFMKRKRLSLIEEISLDSSQSSMKSDNKVPLYMSFGQNNLTNKEPLKQSSDEAFEKVDLPFSIEDVKRANHYLMGDCGIFEYTRFCVEGAAKSQDISKNLREYIRDYTHDLVREAKIAESYKELTGHGVFIPSKDLNDMTQEELVFLLLKKKEESLLVNHRSLVMHKVNNLFKAEDFGIYCKINEDGKMMILVEKTRLLINYLRTDTRYTQLKNFIGVS
jgi:hypothetical protein